MFSCRAGGFGSLNTGLKKKFILKDKQKHRDFGKPFEYLCRNRWYREENKLNATFAAQCRWRNCVFGRGLEIDETKGGNGANVGTVSTRIIVLRNIALKVCINMNDEEPLVDQLRFTRRTQLYVIMMISHRLISTSHWQCFIHISRCCCQARFIFFNNKHLENFWPSLKLTLYFTIWWFLGLLVQILEGVIYIHFGKFRHSFSLQNRREILFASDKIVEDTKRRASWIFFLSYDYCRNFIGRFSTKVNLVLKWK